MSNPPFTQIPLQLEEYFLNRLNVEWRPLPSGGEFRVNRLHLEMTYELTIHADNAHAYQMVLTISGEHIFENASDAGLKFSAVIVGRYRLENAKPEMEPNLARVNGVSLLYSTFRGVFGLVTGSFEHGKVDLPSIDPRAIVKQVEEKRSAAASNTMSPVAAPSGVEPHSN